MNIVHIITGLNRAGAETALLRLVAACPNHDHVVISLTCHGPVADDLAALGVRVETLNLSIRTLFKDLTRLMRTVGEIKPDVIQSWMYHADLLSCLPAAVSRTPLVWGIRNHSLAKEHIGWKTRLVARCCALLSHVAPAFIVCVSDATADAHCSFGYCAKKMHVIENCISVELVPNRIKMQMRQDLGLAVRDFVICRVGRWHMVKNYPALLSALSLIAKRKSHAFRLLLIGKGLGEEDAPVRALADKTTLSNHCVFFGETENAEKLIAISDLLISNSFGEGFPNTVLEALAHGVPSIATDVGASARIVGETGWIMEGFGEDELSAAIARSIDEKNNRPDNWEDRAQMCRDRAHELFSPGTTATKFTTVWTKAISGD